MPPDPRFHGTMIDAHLLDDIGDERADQRAARDKMIELPSNQYAIMLPHSVKAEIDHPNTPSETKNRASAFVYSFDTAIVAPSLLAQAKAIMRGNAVSQKHDQDAEHCCDAAAWGSFFVTLDKRTLKKRDEIRRLLPGLWIMTPAEWVENLEHHERKSPLETDDIARLD